MNRTTFDMKSSSALIAVLLVLAAAGAILAAPTAGSAAVVYNPSATEKRMMSVAGSDYGCLAADRGSYQTVKVSSKTSARKVRAYLKRGRANKRLKISGVVVVPQRYELDNVLEAWINTLNSVPLNGSEVHGLSVRVERTTISSSRRECPHIAVTLSSWPGSTVSSETRNWALELAKRYPRIVRVTEYQLTERPIPPVSE